MLPAAREALRSCARGGLLPVRMRSPAAWTLFRRAVVSARDGRLRVLSLHHSHASLRRPLRILHSKAQAATVAEGLGVSRLLQKQTRPHDLLPRFRGTRLPKMKRTNESCGRFTRNYLISKYNQILSAPRLRNRPRAASHDTSRWYGEQRAGRASGGHWPPITRSASARQANHTESIWKSED